ncbi:homoserine kinase [Anaerorhabdus sp.]|uniref:homoserine kinase n=1 Tax=Anaerorhabdus sp. TaxID=1872524 RepID=UPI002FC6737C
MPTVYVPATSANLGPGFDVLGICFNMFNKFSYSIQDEFECMGFLDTYNLDNNLVIRSYKILFALQNKEVIPIKLIADCTIPIARGLGSSSSCIIAGCVIANEVLNHPYSNNELAKIATTIEGHPDNVIPCLFGGLIASKFEDNHLYTISYEINEKIRFLLLIPDFELETRKAREILKNEVDRDKAIKNIQNTLLLLEGFKTGNEAMLHVGITDYIHVPYRKTLIEEFDILSDIVFDLGAVGFTISGAGPSCIALFTSDIPLNEINAKLSLCKNKWKTVELVPNHKGTYIEE